MEQRFLLKTNYLGETEARQELHVEDLFNGSLKIQHRHVPSNAKVEDRDAAAELIAALGQRHAVHRGGGANLRGR